MFFGISGFILCVPFASRYLLKAQRVKLKPYFLRRLTRLEPPYFISLLVCAALQIIWSHRSAGDIAPHLLASFAYLHNMIYGAFPGAVNTVAWSLEIEIQFYFLAPLLTILFAISKPLLRRGLILLLMLSAGLVSNPLYPTLHLHASIAYYLAFFLAGFLVWIFTDARGMETIVCLGCSSAMRLAVGLASGTERWPCRPSLRDCGALPSGFSRTGLFGGV